MRLPPTPLWLAFFALITTPLLPAADLIDPAARGFGKPAYVADFTWQGDLDLDTGSGGALSLYEGRFNAPVAKFGSDELLIGLSLSYDYTSFDLGGRYPVDADLHATEVQLAARWQPAGSRWWGLAFVTPGLSSDFEDVQDDAFSLTALAIAGYKVSDTFDVAAGVVALYSVGEASVYPAIGFIWRPDDEFIVQATPPIVAIGWTPVPAWTLALVTYPAGGGWSVGDSSDVVRQLDLTLWRVALSLEHKLDEHWSIGVRGGVSFGGELELRDARERVLQDVDLDPAPFVSAALKWSF